MQGRSERPGSSRARRPWRLRAALAALLLAVNPPFPGSAPPAAAVPTEAAASREAPAENVARPGAAALPETAPPDTTGTRVTGDHLRRIQVDGTPVLLLDRVRIEQGSTTVTGRVGRYLRDAGRVLIEDDVVIVDGATRITGDRGTYLVEERRATVVGDVRIEQGTTTIRAPRATYDRDARVARLGGGVEVLDRAEEREVRADSLVYWPDDDRLEAYGRVRIDDEEAEAVVRGEVAEFDRQGDELRVTRRASMVLEERGQPVTVTADTLLFEERRDQVYARGMVRVQQGLTEARSRDAFFDRARDRAILTGTPVAVEPSGTVRGDTLEMEFRAGALERLTARGNAQSVYRRTSGAEAGEEMHLAGDELAVRVRDNAAEEVRVLGDAESLYVPGASQRASGARSNRARGQRIRVLMDRGEPLKALVEGEATGVYTYRLDASSTAAGDTPAADARDDSLAAVQDSLAAGAGTDSLAAGAGADSLAAGAGADSLAAGAGADSLATGALPPPGLAGAGPDSAAADSLLDRILYRAARITFLPQRNEIVLEEEAEVDYGDLHLTAGRVVFAAGTRSLQASGNPVLEDRDDRVDGDLMVYDLDTREGSIRDGVTKFERGIYSGSNLRKTGDGVFHVRGACYTTCDLAEPHYHFAGRQMKIYLNDKVVTRPVGLFITRVPVLALPFYVFPIKRGRQSGLLLPRIEFGVSDVRGRFVHNAGYYWVVNDYSDLELSADINERSPFFIGNMELRYALRYHFTGDLDASITFGEDQRRWDIVGEHRQTIGQDLTLIANANFLSDRSFRRDAQGQFVDDRLETQLRSNVALTRSWESQSLSLRLDRTQNLQDELGETAEGQGRVTGTLPSLSYSFFSRSIGRLPDAKGRGGRWPFLASTSYSFGLGFTNSFDTDRTPDAYLAALDGRGALSDRRDLGPLRVGPSFSVSSRYVERTETTNDEGELVPDTRHVLTGSWRSALDASTDLYGFLAPTLGPYHGFRHTLSPRVSLSYSDPFDSRRDRDAGPGSSSLSLSLQNRLETRLRDGEDFRVLGDFLTFNLSTTYDLSNRSNRRFSPIQLASRCRPGLGRSFEVRYNATYNPYERRTTSYSASSSFSFQRYPTRDADGDEGEGAPVSDEVPGTGVVPDPPADGPGDEIGAAVARTDVFPHAFRFRGTMSYSGGRGSETLQANLGTSFNLTPKWALNYELRYDLIDREVISQNYAITRDLHCWEAQFRRSFSGRRWEYYFRIAIKDLPEIYYERGTSQTRTPSLFGN